MKKKIALALSVGVLMTTVTPLSVSADGARVIVSQTSSSELKSKSEIDVQKHIPRIKLIFQIGDEYNNFDIHKYGHDNTTQLSWSSEDGHIGVGIDEEGNIVSYYKGEYSMNNDRKVHKFSKISRDEGEKIARDFIKKILPEIAEKIEIDSENDIYSRYERYSLEGHTYNFRITENKIPYNNGTIYVRIDSQKGEVISLSTDGQKNLKFPSKEGIISADEAKKLYKENVGIELMYKLKGVDDGFESYLGYAITNTDKTVDAKTKEIVSTSQPYYYSLSRNYIYEKGIEKVSNEDEIRLINSKTIISRKDASKKIVDTFKLGEGYEVVASQVEKVKDEESYVWNVMVTKYEGNGGSGTSASLDAKTGEIIDFSDPGSWGSENNEKVKYKKEELLKKAKDFVQKSNPEKYKQVEYIEGNNMQPYSDAKTYDFEFVRKSNDIKVESSGFRVSINGVTGNIVRYSYGWDDSKLPTPENIIDKDKAKEILLGNKDLELQYQNENQSHENKDQKNIKLVYDFKDKHIVVDANTGEIIDSQKEILEKLSKKDYKDIENSFAKNQIIKLQENIDLFKGDEFKPKDAITQKDFLYLLVQTKEAFYPGDDEEYLYENLIRENIVKKEEKNVEGKVTREEAIKYIVRVFGQEQSGNLGNIYKIDYNDADEISDGLKGHVAIAKGLGVISGEGNFRPKDNLTREEAVVLIFNILNRSK